LQDAGHFKNPHQDAGYGDIRSFIEGCRRQDAGHGLDGGSGGDVKVFCFFSSEKKAFLVLLLEPQEVEATRLPHARMR
jgi:hypothetical protein